MKHKKNKSKKLLVFFLALLFLFVAHFTFRTLQFKENYLVKYDPKYWEERYLSSQWVVPNSQNSIGDDGLYAYAGYKYVFDGLNPILNSAEVPPLGKYLVGYTIFIFGNQNIFGLITGVIALALLYIFNLLIFRNRLLAFLPVFIFSFDVLFWEQLQANYFDLLYLSFLLISFIFTIKKKYLYASIALGCFAATKFPPVSILVALTMLFYVFLINRKDLLKLLISFSLWPIVFVLSFSRFFALGNDIVDFLKVMKYFLNYYATGAKTQNHLMVFEMLLFGRWPTWWTGIIKVEEWNLLWPISFLTTLFSLRKIRELLVDPILIIFIWIFIYLGFLILVPVAPRYLLLLIPFLYNVSVWILSQGIGLKYFRAS